jgi:hypothetical protein
MRRPHADVLMHMRFLTIIAAVLIAMPALPAAALRTLAFDLPASTVTFEISQADGKQDGKTKWQLEVRRNQFTPSISLPPGNYVAASGAFSSPTSFTVPDSRETRYLLLVLPRADGGCSILPIPDDVTRIGPGDRFLINATGEEIAIRFGQRNLSLKPGHSTHLTCPRPVPADHRIEVEMARRADSAWVPFNSTYWPVDPQARSFVLVFPEPGTGTPRVKNLSEVP